MTALLAPFKLLHLTMLQRRALRAALRAAVLHYVDKIEVNQSVPSPNEVSEYVQNHGVGVMDAMNRLNQQRQARRDMSVEHLTMVLARAYLEEHK